MAAASQSIVRAGGVARQRARRRSGPGVEPYLYLLPAVASIALWVYLPLATTFELSFYQWNLLPTAPKVFVGLDNYGRVLALPEIRRALTNTLIYVVGLMAFSIVIPLAIALLLGNVGPRLRNGYRAIVFTPVLVAPVVVAVLWRWILHPVQGLMNLGLGALGVAPVNWFNDPAIAIWAIIGVTAWKHVGFSVLIFSAGLTNISRDYLEAASVDGASGWQSLRHVTLPLLSPTILFMMLLTVLLSAQWTFPLINVLTGGGPFDSTTNVYYVLWQLAFRSFNVGWSAAASVLFFGAFCAIATVFLWLTDRYSFYDA
jgi:multiple sugar transport system permease protein